MMMMMVNNKKLTSEMNLINHLFDKIKYLNLDYQLLNKKMMKTIQELK